MKGGKCHGTPLPTRDGGGTCRGYFFFPSAASHRNKSRKRRVRRGERWRGRGLLRHSPLCKGTGGSGLPPIPLLKLFGFQQMSVLPLFLPQAPRARQTLPFIDPATHREVPIARPPVRCPIGSFLTIPSATMSELSFFSSILPSAASGNPLTPPTSTHYSRPPFRSMKSINPDSLPTHGTCAQTLKLCILQYVVMIVENLYPPLRSHCFPPHTPVCTCLSILSQSYKYNICASTPISAIHAIKPHSHSVSS